mgnify:CR=1 FL=1
MSDGNSMGGLFSFYSYEDLAHYVSTTKPNRGSVNRGRTPLGERKYTSLFWCRTTGNAVFGGHGSSGCIEMFCESNSPVLRWHEDNSIEILSGNSHYDWRFAEFLSKVIRGVHFFTHHRKIYWGEYQMKSSDDRWVLPRLSGNTSDSVIPKNYWGERPYLIYKNGEDMWTPETPIREYKYVMNKKRMREIREKFKPFYEYMKAVLSIDPEFGKSYDGELKLGTFEKFVEMGGHINKWLVNPTDDPSTMIKIHVLDTNKRRNSLT